MREQNTKIATMTPEKYTLHKIRRDSKKKKKKRERQREREREYNQTGEQNRAIH